MSLARRNCRNAVTLSCVILLAASGVQASANPQSDLGGKIFLGYVAGASKGINYDFYTHLCHAFVVAKKDGTLLPKPNVPNRQLVKAAHQEGVSVLLSLGGWGWDDNFAAMSLDSQAEDRYVAAVMAIVDDYEYDGIDLDWEYPDTNIEIVGFERLARRFRVSLDELGRAKDRPMLLTMAAAAHPTTLKWLRSEFLLETMDWINVMTYDYCGSWANFSGHHAPLYDSDKAPRGDRWSVSTTIDHLLQERGFPADRIALGLPLYGRGFAVGETYSSTIDAPKPKHESANYSTIHQMLAQANWIRRWDDQTKTPWLLSRNGKEIIGYDDRESIAIKTNWAVKKGLRGVFFWQVDGDRLPDGSNPLQQCSHEIMLGNSTE